MKRIDEKKRNIETSLLHVSQKLNFFVYLIEELSLHSERVCAKKKIAKKIEYLYLVSSKLAKINEFFFCRFRLCWNSILDIYLHELIDAQ